MKPFALALLIALPATLCLPPAATAHEPLKVSKLVERKIAQLPAGPLFWRLENFPDSPAAQAAAGPWSLVATAAGKVWLFTLGPPGGSSAGGTPVAELGPIPRPAAANYLIRINEATGAPGSVTAVHTHPGSEAFYVIAGETSSRTPAGVQKIAAGRAVTGHAADTPMQVSSSGTTDLHSLVMFLVDADRPFSTPAQMP